jgi:hypothetical protein
MPHYRQVERCVAPPQPEGQIDMDVDDEDCCKLVSDILNFSSLASVERFVACCQ